MQVTRSSKRSGPLIAAGTLLGLGMGGFLDGIILHQILQWHQMISNVLPPDTLVNMEINMFWDGIFHMFTWTLTAAGLIVLWQLFGLAQAGAGWFIIQRGRRAGAR